MGEDREPMSEHNNGNENQNDSVAFGLAEGDRVQITFGNYPGDPAPEMLAGEITRATWWCFEFIPSGGSYRYFDAYCLTDTDRIRVYLASETVHVYHPDRGIDNVSQLGQDVQVELLEAGADGGEMVADGGERAAEGGEDDENEPEADPHYNPDVPCVSDAWVGSFIYESWGYNQTNVDFAQIVEVSDSGKTVKARRVAAKVESRSKGSDSVLPAAGQFGDEFRLYVRDVRGEPWFKGTYPMGSDGDMDGATRKGQFSEVGNTPNQGIHQTPTGYGH